MIGRLEDHELWRQARVLVCAIYGVTGRGGFFRDARLRDEVRGCAVSVMSLVARAVEVDARRRSSEIATTLEQTDGPCVRLRCELVVAADQGYLSEVELAGLDGQVRGFVAAVSRFVAELRKPEESSAVPRLAGANGAGSG